MRQFISLILKSLPFILGYGQTKIPKAVTKVEEGLVPHYPNDHKLTSQERKDISDSLHALSVYKLNEDEKKMLIVEPKILIGLPDSSPAYPPGLFLKRL